jgi:dihydroorotate dehydrogenase
MYRIIRSILFLFPTEGVHYFSMNFMKAICSVRPIRNLVSSWFTPKNRSLERIVFNLHFRNPVGLGAGFDKNAKYLRELEAMGFGFVEVGTVTPLPQEGNPRPRLFRLKKDKALINRMGFNNDGVKVITGRLKKWRQHKFSKRIIVGGNIGKNKITPNEDAWKDYEYCFKELHNYVDYFVVNVSSPNTPGLRELQEKDSLRKILRHLQMINNGKAHAKPILLKIAPDLNNDQLNDVIDLAQEIRLDGLVATNTTIERGELKELEISTRESGGLSGQPLRERSTEIVKYIHDRSRGQLPVIASGGIFSAADAKEKVRAGANLLQVWTSFIYEGPGIVKRICKQL